MEQPGDIYDAFGERTPAPHPMSCTPTARRARVAAIALFWSLALLIVVGRVHYGPIQAVASTAIALASR